MYVIDYPNQKIKKFSNQELESFLNKVIKKRWIFVKDQLDEFLQVLGQKSKV